MKKRLISLTLTVFLILQSVCMIASATPAETEPAPEIPTATQDAIDFLVNLGILDADFDANGTATKSSFLCMALDAVKVETILSEQQLFSDVPLSYYAADAIATAYKTGYIKGNGNGTFSPDKLINVNEALSIAMNILNYGHLAGTNSYQITIKNQDLLKDVQTKDGGILNNGSCAVILKNMLLAEYNMLSGIEGNAGIYQTNEHTTLLYLMYSVVRDEGIVTAVDDIYLDGHKSVKQGYMALNDVVVEDPEGLANDMLGFYVELFAKEDDGEYSLISINKSSRRNEEIILEADDLTNKSTATKIVYKTDADKEKTIDLPTDYTLIYNGRNYNGFTNNVFNITQGKVRLVSNNGGDYTLVYVYEYEDFIIKNVNYSDEKIYLENSTQVIDYGKNKEVVLLDAKGEVADASVFYAGLVVTVFKAKGSYTFKTVQAGQGDYIMKPDGRDDKFVYMGEEKLRFASSSATMLNQVALGTKTVFSLDAFGDVVDFKTVSTGTMYGYLVDIEVADNSFGEVVYGVKIFTENNKMEVFQTEEKMKLNGVKDESSTIIGNFMSGGACVPQLIKFVATDDDILKEIIDCTDKTLVENYVGYDEDNFTLDYIAGKWNEETQSYETFQYRSGNNSIDTKYIVNGSTLRFVIPADGNEKNYRCTTCAGGLNDSKTSGVTYKLFDANKKRVASVLLEVSNTSISSFGNEYKTPAIITDISHSVNSEGFEVLVIKGYVGKEEVRFIADDETLEDAGEVCSAFSGIKASQLQCGDVVQFNTAGADNEIQAMRILYRRSEPQAYDEWGTSMGTVNVRDYYAWLYATSAKVLEQYEDVVIAHTNRNATATGSAARKRVFPFDGSVQFYVYDSTRNKLTKTDMSEYMIGCNVFITASLSTPKMVVIYK